MAHGPSSSTAHQNDKVLLVIDSPLLAAHFTRELLYHPTTDTFVVMVDPLGKEAAGNRIETIRFSKGAAQSISTLSTGATSILSGELLSYADLADRFGKDLAFAYGISSEAGPLSLKTTLSENLALVR